MNDSSSYMIYVLLEAPSDSPQGGETETGFFVYNLFILRSSLFSYPPPLGELEGAFFILHSSLVPSPSPYSTEWFHGHQHI